MIETTTDMTPKAKLARLTQTLAQDTGESVSDVVNESAFGANALTTQAENMMLLRILKTGVTFRAQNALQNAIRRLAISSPQSVMADDGTEVIVSCEKQATPTVIKYAAYLRKTDTNEAQALGEWRCENVR